MVLAKHVASLMKKRNAILRNSIRETKKQIRANEMFVKSYEKALQRRKKEM